ARAWGVPRINPLFKRWNPLQVALELAHEQGLAVWAFARPYNFHPRYSIAEHKLMDRYERWRLRAHPDFLTAHTRRYERWHPCPLNPEYRRYVGDLMTELVAGYPIEGLLLYYTSYGLHGGSIAQSPYCFCESCRRL